MAHDEMPLYKLHAVAKEQGVPYQALIRLVILAGVERWGRASG